MAEPIRLCEWGRVAVPQLSMATRVALEQAVEAWQAAARLPDAPLSFHGAEQQVLSARQYVGVIEVADCVVEIYPKLDSESLAADALDDPSQATTVMANLLWMLEVCCFMEMTETDTANLSGAPVSYYDLFAFLMAKNLSQQLELGVVHAYMDSSDDLQAVRGRINLLEQLTRNWNRFDRVSCTWDEFTPDIPLNRILKCACRILQSRVQNPAPARLLDECCLLLDEVSEIDVMTAVAEARHMRWNRSNDRYQVCFDMAARLLAGAGYHLGHGTGESFVFLLDMNRVFESFAAAAISAHFGVPVQEQRSVGHLFTAPHQAIKQVPDYVWSSGGTRWIGDAKYKHLSAGQVDSVVFDPSAEIYADKSHIRADSTLRPDDVRQLTVYSEIDRLRRGRDSPPSLLVAYPFAGKGVFKATKAIVWNGAEFWLTPMRVNQPVSAAEIMAPVVTSGPQIGAVVALA